MGRTRQENLRQATERPLTILPRAILKVVIRTEVVREVYWKCCLDPNIPSRFGSSADIAFHYDDFWIRLFQRKVTDTR